MSSFGCASFPSSRWKPSTASAAADKQRSLNEAQAIAAKQQELTNSQVQIRIAENQGDADLSRSRKQAEQAVVMAEAELARSRRQAEQMVVTAQAESQQRVLAGRGESARVLQVGLSEASVLLRKISSFGDPRLYVLQLVADSLSKSTQPLVPERLFIAGGSGNGEGNGESHPAASGAQGMLGMLINLLVSEKSGFQMSDNADLGALKELADRMTKETLANMEQVGNAPGALSSRSHQPSCRRRAHSGQANAPKRADQVKDLKTPRGTGGPPGVSFMRGRSGCPIKDPLPPSRGDRALISGKRAVFSPAPSKVAHLPLSIRPLPDDCASQCFNPSAWRGLVWKEILMSHPGKS